MAALARALIVFGACLAVFLAAVPADAGNRVVCIKNRSNERATIKYQYRWCTVQGSCTLWTNASVSVQDDRRRYWLENLPDDKPDGYLMEVYHPGAADGFATTIVTGALEKDAKDCIPAATYHFCDGDAVRLVPAEIGCPTLRPSPAVGGTTQGKAQ